MKKQKNLEILVKRQDQELQGINEDLDGIEDIEETVDNNLRKNNLNTYEAYVRVLRGET